MAGVALFIAKNDNNNLDFIKSKLEVYLKDKFSFFPEISIEKKNRRYLLIQFRKTINHSKYYKDNQGNWLTYSGHVFALKETKIYSAKELWELYSQYKVGITEKLDGHFIIKIYDAKQDKIIVFNDFFKNRSEFFCETENYFLFTPFHILSAVIQKPGLDFYALNEIFWRYYILSDRTILKNVSRLKRASLYQINNSEIKTSIYWSWPKHYTKISFKEASDKLTNSMMESARLVQQFKKTPVMELTMGQDSRQVAAGFTNQKIPFVSAIYGKDDFHEVQGVKEMMRRLNIENIHIKLENDYLEKPWHFFKKGVFLSSNEEPGYMIGRILYMREKYKIKSDLVLNGVQGRYYKDGLWNEMYVMNLYREPKKLKKELLIKYRVMNNKYPVYIFNQEFRNIHKQSAGYFKYMMDESVKGMEKSPVCIQVEKYDTEHYAVFGYVANTTCDLIVDVISPLLFKRNLDLALVFPAKWKFNLSKIQRAVVYNLDKELAKERTDLANVNMLPKNGIAFIPFIIKYWLAVSKKYRDKIKNLLGLSAKTQLQKAWDYLPLYKEILKNKEVLNHLNYDKMILAEILDKNGWNEFKEQFKPGGISYNKTSDYEFLFKILSTEYFLREAQFLNDYIEN